jgi:hypothetical protein
MNPPHNSLRSHFVSLAVADEDVVDEGGRVGQGRRCRAPVFSDALLPSSLMTSVRIVSIVPLLPKL